MRVLDRGDESLVALDPQADYLAGDGGLVQYHHRVIGYLPALTTLLAIAFSAALLARYRRRHSGLHLLWWAAGVACYGAGTALETVISARGNGPWLNRTWYVAGAVLGAWPLAQGSVYLLFSRRTAHRLTAISLPLALSLAVAVLLSPVDVSLVESHRPGGAALGWQWIRRGTIPLNLYSVVFLVGGAASSAYRYARRGDSGGRALGNTLIAAGAILPAIGGTMARSGNVEALYVAELFGLMLIAAGYRVCVGVEG